MRRKPTSSPTSRTIATTGSHPIAFDEIPRLPRRRGQRSVRRDRVTASRHHDRLTELRQSRRYPLDRGSPHDRLMAATAL